MIQIPDFIMGLLAQVPQAASSGSDAAVDAPQQAPGLFDGWGFFLPAMLAVMLVWLLFMPKPQQNQAVKTSDLLKKLKKNDRVITAGGILGTVANFGTEEEFVTLRIDDDKNTRMQVLATSIVRIVSDEKEGNKDSKSSK